MTRHRPARLRKGARQAQNMMLEEITCTKRRIASLRKHADDPVIVDHLAALLEVSITRLELFLITEYEQLTRWEIEIEPEETEDKLLTTIQAMQEQLSTLIARIEEKE